MDSVPVPGKDLPAIGGEIAGKYRVESVLGQGGMGAVFAARNMATGKRVAIKWLLPQLASTASRERLMREARIAGEIEHPNVVDVYDMGEHEGGLFLVMEYLRGRSLADVLAVRGRLAPEELIPLLVPAMRGVHAAHLKGIVHRDLKPENIFLSEIDGVIIPKVLDFGVSKSIDALSEAPSPLTRTGALVGTPHYMALEQVDGSGTIDQRTDVYGFGVLLYRALTGYFPFDGSSLGEVILKIGTTQPTAPRLLRPELSEELEAVIMRALSRDRNARFPELESFALALIPFVPPTYVTLDGSPRYSISGDPRTASLGSIPPISGSRSVRSIVRDAPFPITHSGLSFHGTGTHAPARYPSRALWAAALSVLLAIASIAAWALTRPAEQPDGALGALPPSLPSPAEPAPARGSVLGQTAPTVATPPVPAAQSAAPALEQGVAGAEAPTGVASAVDEAPGAPEQQPSDAVGGPAAGPARVPNGPRKAKAQGAKAQKGSRVIPGDRTKGLSSDEF